MRTTSTAMPCIVSWMTVRHIMWHSCRLTLMMMTAICSRSSASAGARLRRCKSACQIVCLPACLHPQSNKQTHKHIHVPQARPLDERAPCPCVVDVFELHRLCIELCTSCGISFSLILASHLHRICIELYKNPMQMRCKCDANAMLPLMGKEVQLHRICIVMKKKYDAKAMQITIQMRCKCG